MLNILTLMRNSEPYIDRFFEQIAQIDQQHRIFVGTGDNKDFTLQRLSTYEERLNNLHVIDVAHGGDDFGSVVNKQRFLQLAYAGNLVWNQASKYKSDITVWIDADLKYSKDTLLRLELEVSTYTPVIAPAIILNRRGFPTNTFYDTFCFRRDGKRLKPTFFDEYIPGDMMPIYMDSVGGFVMMLSEIANQVYFPAKDVFIGMCNQITDLGYPIYMQPNVQVYHE